jgi:predicted RNase H-like HicB family nuclease
LGDPSVAWYNAVKEAAMKFTIALYPSEEGYAVGVPSLPGCWSQGATKEEALENVSYAIREYLGTEPQPPEAGSASIHSGPNGGPALTEEAEVREVEIAD